MTLTLAINTASKESAIALLVEGRLVGEESWISAANESERVLPGLQKLLELAGKEWSGVSEVFVVKGPGSYTSLRVGITIANAIAWVRKIPMVAMDVFELWESRIAPEKRKVPHVVGVKAWSGLYLVKGKSEPVSLEEIVAHGMPCYGDFPGDFTLKRGVDFTFGEALEQVNFRGFEQVDSVEPLYARAPDITPPKK